MKNRSPMVKIIGRSNKSHAKEDGCKGMTGKNPAKKRTRNYRPPKGKQ